MNLLVFAHRGEAQEFIKKLSMKGVSGHPGLYLNEDTALLITGEGIYEVFSKLGQILGEYSITKVFNLGIAGALEKSIRLNSFHEIKTVYCHTGKPQFQSFTLNSENSGIDVITSSERVLDDSYANELSNFAPLVDRELWAIAKVCDECSIPLRSFKLVSDMAGKSTDCFDLKEKALEFSTRLLEFWLGIEGDQEEEPGSQEPPIQMSFTQKAKYRSLVKALGLKEGFDLASFESKALAEMKEGLSSKQKANLLLEAMELGLNPVKLSTKKQFEKLSTPVQAIGARLLFDKNFEKKKFTLQMEINDQKNIDNLSKLSEILKFSDFEKVWNGELDV
tara:strand:+ start:121498 stop:122502 length:1005 start_codon:yes stop_codon:yes gene_type:complete